ncbi:hypothetical protein SUGI_0128030 [Cryptomeria japonica]|nr:hypothetical protein SUGI_0128030 [Cryptomeria japonica]
MAATSLFISNSFSSCLFSQRQTLSSKSYLHDYPTAIPFSCSSTCFSTHKLNYFSAPKTYALRSSKFHKKLAPPVKGGGSSTLQYTEDEEAPSAAAIVDRFYAAINRKDVKLLSKLLAEDCTLYCMFFFQPFKGKDNVMMFLWDLMDSMDSQMQFVIDETTEGKPHKVAELWHLEQKKEKFYLGSGCSFHNCKSYQGKLLITDIQIFTDLPIKLDILAFAFVKVVRKIHVQLKRQKAQKVYQHIYMRSLLLLLIF